MQTLFRKHKLPLAQKKLDGSLYLAIQNLSQFEPHFSKGKRLLQKPLPFFLPVQSS